MQKTYKDTTKIAHLQIFRKENVSETDFFYVVAPFGLAQGWCYGIKTDCAAIFSLRKLRRNVPQEAAVFSRWDCCKQAGALEDTNFFPEFANFSAKKSQNIEKSSEFSYFSHFSALACKNLLITFAYFKLFLYLCIRISPTSRDYVLRVGKYRHINGVLRALFWLT